MFIVKFINNFQRINSLIKLSDHWRKYQFDSHEHISGKHEAKSWKRLRYKQAACPHMPSWCRREHCALESSFFAAAAQKKLLSAKIQYEG